MSRSHRNNLEKSQILKEKCRYAIDPSTDPAGNGHTQRSLAEWKEDQQKGVIA